jgi:hypothetical protein
MSIPRRMNEVPVQIQQLDRTEALIDSDYRESTPKKYSSTVLSLNAQVGYTKKDEQKDSLSGNQENSLGRLVFRKSYLDGLSITLTVGDLIISIANFPVKYKIREIRPAGHLNGVANLLRCEFEEYTFERQSK